MEASRDWVTCQLLSSRARSFSSPSDSIIPHYPSKTRSYKSDAEWQITCQGKGWNFRSHCVWGATAWSEHPQRVGAGKEMPEGAWKSAVLWVRGTLPSMHSLHLGVLGEISQMWPNSPLSLKFPFSFHPPPQPPVFPTLYFSALFPLVQSFAHAQFSCLVSVSSLPPASFHFAAHIQFSGMRPPIGMTHIFKGL